MSQPLISVHANRTIRIDYPRLFGHRGGKPYEDFLNRGFEVEEVVSVEVDRIAGLALVRLHPRCESARPVLARLAQKLGETRNASFDPPLQPHFILQEDGHRIVYARAPKTAKGLRRVLYGGLGCLFFGLSIVGVATPILPTTPFVILSSYYALRSSPELNERLLKSRLFGRILNDWYLHRAMRRSTKRRVLIFMVVVFAVSISLMDPASPSLPFALLISLFSFGFVLQMPGVDDDADLLSESHTLDGWRERPLLPVPS